MESKDIKSTIKDHFSETSMSSENIDKLLKTQAGILSDLKENNHTTNNSRRFLWLIAVTAVFIAIFSYNELFEKKDLTSQIAAEVAYNHHKLKDPEVFSSSYIAIQNKLSKLDFSIVTSKLLSPAMILIGGRYCSIKGVLAAQLRYRHSDTGKTVTMYQVPTTKQYKKAFNALIETQIDGITVKIWQEKGLLIAEAS